MAASRSVSQKSIRCYHSPEDRKISMLIRELFTKSRKHAEKYTESGPDRVWRIGNLEIVLCRGCQMPCIDALPWPMLDDFQTTLLLITEIARVSGTMPIMP